MRRGYANTRLGQLHYATAGDADGTPLILLPKTARTWRMYVGLAGQLSRDYKIYALDYPGTGSSDPLPPGTTFETIAATCIDFLDELGIADALVYGLLTGNKIAAAMAAHWPARVKKVVLAGQSHSLVPNIEKRSGTVGKTRRKLPAADAREAALIRWADAYSRVTEFWWCEEMARGLADEKTRGQAIDRAVEELLTTESIPELYRANFAYDLQRDLERITVPTLVLEIATPSEDRLIGRQGPLIQSLVRGSRLVTLEEPDFHGITLENRVEDLAAILREFFR